MIKNKTVFVLGAGASYPYGYPLGKDLRIKICNNFAENYSNWSHIELSRNVVTPNPDYDKKIQEARKFVKVFDASNIKSIDKFLSFNPEFQLYGKLAIVFGILNAESTSKTINHEQDWYFWLFNEMIDEIKGKNDYSKFLNDNNISFVTFNYDRSLEHFLYTSFSNTFNGIESPDIIKQINDIPIVHVFGSIAPLKWQDPNGIEYKKHIKQIAVEDLPDRLWIIYDKGHNPNIEAAQKLIKEADRIFFLGFGYAKENLDILNIPNILNLKQRIYGTAIGFNDKEVDVISAGLKVEGNHRVFISNTKDCLQLLREHLE